MDRGDELRVALLCNGMDKALSEPVDGVLDADELAKEGKATLAINGGRWYMVRAEDVRIMPSMAVGDVMPAGWLVEAA